jgi:hypothetical protein
MDVIEKSGKAKLINYSHFLSKFPPQYEVEIFENSSWSCVHGIERWRSDCGCNTGGNLSWNQKWRAPLREALDWLAEKLNNVYEEEMKDFHSHPWTLRNAYIDIILDRNEVAVNNFIFDQCKIHLNDLDRTKFLRLLEMQRQVMLMYTSCAWFFDEASGIETIQVLQYADRAIQLAESETSERFTQDFLEYLSNVKSNVAEYENASKLAKQNVKEEVEQLDEKKNLPGLWANIRAKKARGESPAKPGEKDYPEDLESVRSGGKKSVKESYDVPFNKPYNKDSGTTTDKSGAKHTPMSKARNLAQQALSRTSSKKADTKQQARNAFDGMFGGGNPADKLGIMKKESASEPTEGEIKGKQGYSRKAQIVMNASKGKKSDSPEKYQKDPELSSEIHKT